MTIQQYIEHLIADGCQVARVAVSDGYLPVSSPINVSSGPVTIEHHTFEAPDICEFYDSAGVLTARARGFSGII